MVRRVSGTQRVPPTLVGIWGVTQQAWRLVPVLFTWVSSSCRDDKGSLVELFFPSMASLTANSYQWARQWVTTRSGLSFTIKAATPFLWPTMLLAPSHVWPISFRSSIPCLCSVSHIDWYMSWELVDSGKANGKKHCCLLPSWEKWRYIDSCSSPEMSVAPFRMRL